MSIQEMVYAQVALFNKDKEGTVFFQGESWSYILHDTENN
jgi:hypothetical protein